MFPVICESRWYTLCTHIQGMFVLSEVQDIISTELTIIYWFGTSGHLLFAINYSQQTLWCSVQYIVCYFSDDKKSLNFPLSGL